MKKYYMVGKIDYQYNDEIYYRAEGETVVPVKLFTTYEKAEHEKMKLTRKSLQDWGELFQFGYGPQDVINNIDIFKQLLAGKGVTVDIDEYEDWGSDKVINAALAMNDAEFAAFMNNLKMNFYEITEVYLDD